MVDNDFNASTPLSRCRKQSAYIQGLLPSWKPLKPGDYRGLEPTRLQGFEHEYVDTCNYPPQKYGVYGWAAPASSSPILRSISVTALSCKSNSSFSLYAVSIHPQQMKMKESGKNLLFKRQPLLRIQPCKYIVPLPVKLQNILMVLPQAPSMAHRH